MKKQLMLISIFYAGICNGANFPDTCFESSSVKPITNNISKIQIGLSSDIRSFGSFIEYYDNQNKVFSNSMDCRPDKGLLKCRLEGDAGSLYIQTQNYLITSNNKTIQVSFNGNPDIDKSEPSDSRAVVVPDKNAKQQSVTLHIINQCSRNTLSIPSEKNINNYQFVTQTIHEDNKQEKYNIEVNYPILSGKNLNASANQFNDGMKYIIDKNIESFKVGNEVENKILKDKTLTNYKINYDLNVLLPKRMPIISVRFNLSKQDEYSNSSRTSIYHFSINYNFNEGSGKNMTLASLFKPNTDYKTILDGYMLNKLNTNKKLSEVEKKQVVMDEPQFNLNHDGLLLTYDNGAPSVGPQEVLVPYSALANIISSASPISICVNKPAECN